MDWLAWIYRKLALPRLNSNNTIFHQFCFLVHLDVVNITKKFCKYNQIRALTALDLSTKQFFAVLVSRHPTPTDDEITSGLARLCKKFAFFPAQINVDRGGVFKGPNFKELVRKITGTEVQIISGCPNLEAQNGNLKRIVQGVVGIINSKLLDPGNCSGQPFLEVFEKVTEALTPDSGINEKNIISSLLDLHERFHI